MTIEFDPTKSARNEQERGLPFELVAKLEWERALAFVDERRDYGETRVVTLAPMQERLYAVCYVMPRPGTPDHQLSQGEQTGGAYPWPKHR